MVKVVPDREPEQDDIAAEVHAAAVSSGVMSVLEEARDTAEGGSAHHIIAFIIFGKHIELFIIGFKVRYQWELTSEPTYTEPTHHTLMVSAHPPAPSPTHSQVD